MELGVCTLLHSCDGKSSRVVGVTYKQQQELYATTSSSSSSTADSSPEIVVTTDSQVVVYKTLAGRKTHQWSFRAGPGCFRRLTQPAVFIPITRRYVSVQDKHVLLSWQEKDAEVKDNVLRCAASPFLTAIHSCPALADTLCVVLGGPEERDRGVVLYRGDLKELARASPPPLPVVDRVSDEDKAVVVCSWVSGFKCFVVEQRKKKARKVERIGVSGIVQSRDESLGSSDGSWVTEAWLSVYELRQGSLYGGHALGHLTTSPSSSGKGNMRQQRETSLKYEHAHLATFRFSLLLQRPTMAATVAAAASSSSSSSDVVGAVYHEGLAAVSVLWSVAGSRYVWIQQRIGQGQIVAGAGVEGRSTLASAIAFDRVVVDRCSGSRREAVHETGDEEGIGGANKAEGEGHSNSETPKQKARATQALPDCGVMMALVPPSYLLFMGIPSVEGGVRENELGERGRMVADLWDASFGVCLNKALRLEGTDSGYGTGGASVWWSEGQCRGVCVDSVGSSLAFFGDKGVACCSLRRSAQDVVGDEGSLAAVLSQHWREEVRARSLQQEEKEHVDDSDEAEADGWAAGPATVIAATASVDFGTTAALGVSFGRRHTAHLEKNNEALRLLDGSFGAVDSKEWADKVLHATGESDEADAYVTERLRRAAQEGDADTFSAILAEAAQRPPPSRPLQQPCNVARCDGGCEKAERTQNCLTEDLPGTCHICNGTLSADVINDPSSPTARRRGTASVTAAMDEKRQRKDASSRLSATSRHYPSTVVDVAVAAVVSQPTPSLQLWEALAPVLASGQVSVWRRHCRHLIDALIATQNTDLLELVLQKVPDIREDDLVTVLRYFLSAAADCGGRHEAVVKGGGQGNVSRETAAPVGAVATGLAGVRMNGNLHHDGDGSGSDSFKASKSDDDDGSGETQLSHKGPSGKRKRKRTGGTCSATAGGRKVDSRAGLKARRVRGEAADTAMNGHREGAGARATTIVESLSVSYGDGVGERSDGDTSPHTAEHTSTEKTKKMLDVTKGREEIQRHQSEGGGKKKGLTQKLRPSLSMADRLLRVVLAVKYNSTFLRSALGRLSRLEALFLLTLLCRLIAKGKVAENADAVKVARILERPLPPSTGTIVGWVGLLIESHFLNMLVHLRGTGDTDKQLLAKVLLNMQQHLQRQVEVCEGLVEVEACISKVREGAGRRSFAGKGGERHNGIATSRAPPHVQQKLTDYAFEVVKF